MTPPPRISVTHKHIWWYLYHRLFWLLVLLLSLALFCENVLSVGWTLVTTQNTDDDYDDNDNIISENPKSCGNNSCSSGLQGCLGVPDPPTATFPQSHSCNVPPSPPEEPLGQPDRGEETVKVSQAEQKYSTLQLALPMY